MLFAELVAVYEGVSYFVQTRLGFTKGTDERKIEQ
jgi:hypothetical protein